MRLLSRLIVLLVLLPQMLVLGMGRGLVICVAPDGHVQIELAASECCSATPEVAPDTCGGRSATWISGGVAKTIVCSTMFSSSRTLPG